PSTADEWDDDPTARRCIGFAQNWGFGALALVNLFAYRSTEPAGLLQAEDPVGPANDTHILASARTATRIVLAWGAKGGLARSRPARRLADSGRPLSRHYQRRLSKTSAVPPKDDPPETVLCGFSGCSRTGYGNSGSAS